MRRSRVTIFFLWVLRSTEPSVVGGSVFASGATAMCRQVLHAHRSEMIHAKASANTYKSILLASAARKVGANVFCVGWVWSGRLGCCEFSWSLIQGKRVHAFEASALVRRNARIDGFEEGRCHFFLQALPLRARYAVQGSRTSAELEEMTHAFKVNAIARFRAAHTGIQSGCAGIRASCGLLSCLIHNASRTTACETERSTG